MKMLKNQSRNTSLVLRVCRPDYTSHNGFVWLSEVGVEVVAPDWRKNEKCGNGLHGWLYGQGDYACVMYWEDNDAKWMVLEVPSAEIVMLDGKCKFPRATVRFVGTRSEAAAFIIANEPNALDTTVIGACLKVGDDEVVRVGNLGTATAGKNGTASAGDYGTASAGDYGTASAGHRGRATAGIGGTATAGYLGTATAGHRGTATAGIGGTATAGEHGVIRLQWCDSQANRVRTKIGYVGEDGIEPGTAYCLNDKHEFVPCDAARVGSKK